MGTDFVHVRFERIGHWKRWTAAELKDGPVNDVCGEEPFFCPWVFGLCRRPTGKEVANQFAAAKGSCVPWRVLLRKFHSQPRQRRRNAAAATREVPAVAVAAAGRSYPVTDTLYAKIVSSPRGTCAIADTIVADLAGADNVYCCA